jgi:hypothetical protein
MVQVIFTYDEALRLWEPRVKGASNNIEAKQAFNAVVVTLRQVIPCMLHETERIGEDYRISPAV